MNERVRNFAMGLLLVSGALGFGLLFATALLVLLL